ncbi:MAG: PorT family protein [Gemmatimonadetes bacterium]|nr:PorT family protein [Gemmatimonadota bacterium]MYG22467.1 PorT family protein [Gemmatimonadota bacterium]MYJ39559.1 PorT family protein [Gemmatimonadota bacterium]
MRPGARCALVLAAAMVVAAPCAAAAQPAFGVIAGLNRANFTGGGAVDVSPRTGAMIGLVGDIPVGPRFSVRPELHFSAKGSQVRTEAGDPADGPSKTFGVSYIQMPVLVQLRSASDGPVRPQLFGGLSAGVLLGCNLGSLDCADVEGIDQSGVDVGVVVGVELAMGRIGVGARYEVGVRAVDASVPGNEIYNGVASLTARYTLRR